MQQTINHLGLEKCFSDFYETAFLKRITHC
jgi:hypothetical protein